MLRKSELRERIAVAIRERAKRQAVPVPDADGFGRGQVTEYDLADAVLAALPRRTWWRRHTDS